MAYEDPWAWMDHQKPSQTVPNTVQYQPQPEAQPVQHIQQQQDPLVSMVEMRAANKGLDQFGNAVDAGLKYRAPLSAGTGLTPTSAVDSGAMTLTAPTTTGLVTSGVPEGYALTGAPIGSGLTAAASTAAEAGAPLTTAAGTATTVAPITGLAAEGGAADAMMGAMGPIGWGMLGLMAAKRLKLF
jgi:hypothetical protein